MSHKVSSFVVLMVSFTSVSSCRVGAGQLCGPWVSWQVACGVVFCLASQSLSTPIPSPLVIRAAVAPRCEHGQDCEGALSFGRHYLENSSKFIIFIPFGIGILSTYLVFQSSQSTSQHYGDRLGDFSPTSVFKIICIPKMAVFTVIGTDTSELSLLRCLEIGGCGAR